MDCEDDGGEVITSSLAVRTSTGVGTCRGSEEIGVEEEGDGRELIVSSVVFSSGLSLNALAMASSLRTGWGPGKPGMPDNGSGGGVKPESV